MTFTRDELAMIETSLFIASSIIPQSFQIEAKQLQEKISAEITRIKLEET